MQEARQSGADLITNRPAFFEVDFDDSAWPSGPAPLGTEPGSLPDGLEITTPVLSPAAGGPITTYYRLRFRLPVAPTELQALRMRQVLFDDGFVAYLNGVEVARACVPKNQDSRTLAGGCVIEPPMAFDLPLHLLVAATRSIPTRPFGIWPVKWFCWTPSPSARGPTTIQARTRARPGDWPASTTAVGPVGSHCFMESAAHLAPWICPGTPSSACPTTLSLRRFSSRPSISEAILTCRPPS